jgi:hypothetical protein
MAGMQHFVLFDEIDKAHTRKSGDSRAAFGNRMLSAVPLWKVIVGPSADKTITGPSRSGFFFGSPEPVRPHCRLPQSELISSL